MAGTKTPSFVLELEVSFKQRLLSKYLLDSKTRVGTMQTLDKKINTAISIRNTAKGEAMRRLRKLQHDCEYQALQKTYAVNKKADPGYDGSDLSKAYSQLYKKYGYSEFDLHAYVVQAKDHFKCIGIDECQKMASQAFKAVEKVRTGKSEKVNYLSRFADSSVEGKSKNSSLKYIGNLCIQFGRGNIYPLVIKKNDTYAQEALKHKVKYVRLIRRTIRGKHRYFVQLVLEGIPPKTKNLKHGSTKSRVGLDEGISTIAIVSNEEVSLKELAPDTSTDEKELRRLNRAIDRSTRATNPQNYNADGTIKKGKKIWNYSNRCKKLKGKRKELYRKSAAKRETSHNALANHIVSLGLDIRVEEMRISALAKRSSKTTKNKKNGKINSKKRYGKTVMSRAPASLIDAINKKLGYIGFHIKKIDTFQVKASQYDHKSNTYKKKNLSDRWHTFTDGSKVQRDLYSAFLVCCTNDELNRVDRKACLRSFDNFIKLHDDEVAHILEENGKTLHWYVA